MIKKAALFLLLLGVGACSTTGTSTHEIADPLEGFNRPMFAFNDALDESVLVPVAKGYRFVTTEWVRNRFSAASANLGEPKTVVNYTLQGEPGNMTVSLGRFLVNSTLGLLGTFDVATGWGWTVDKTNFDQTLGKYCIPDGPFLVLPFVPATTPRAFVAGFVDGYANPVWMATQSREDGIYVYAGYYVADMIIMREANLEFIDDIKKNSVDYYATMRAMYMQNKSKYNRCQGGDSTDAYDFDFDEE